MAKTPRTWTGARTPSGLKRVRQAERRHEILQPRRTAAKTYVAKALDAATNNGDGAEAAAALAVAHAALDRAAKAGAIHPNAAARRKSRLTLKFNAATGGAQVQTSGRVTKTDEQGPGGEGRQEPHRRRQGRQGEGRPDRRRQGPRRALEDRPRRRRGEGRGHDRHGRDGGRTGQVDDHGEGQGRAEDATKAAAPKATAKKAPAKKAPAKKAAKS